MSLLTKALAILAGDVGLEGPATPKTVPYRSTDHNKYLNIEPYGLGGPVPSTELENRVADNSDLRTGATQGAPSWFTHPHRRAATIEAALELLPSPTTKDGAQLVEKTYEYLASPWHAAAIAADWPLVELFGICPVAPTARIDRQGLVTGLGLSVHSGAVIIDIQPELARIQHRSGNILSYRKGQPAMVEAVVWWECAALIGGD